MARYLLGSVAKQFRQTVRTRRVKKAKAKAQRQKQFRKGFLHKSSEPKSFDTKANLPTRGKSRTKTFKRRVKRFFN